MASIYDVYPNDLINKAAEELKKLPEFQPPEWAAFVKTGAHRERPPVDQDWWSHRAAALLRTIQILGPIGVSKLRTKYGGKKRRGHQPPEFRRGSGSIIRKALQQLDKAGFTKFAEKGIHKGRIITPKGKSFLEKIASQLAKQIERTTYEPVDLAVYEKKPARKELKIKKEEKAQAEQPAPKKEFHPKRFPKKEIPAQKAEVPKPEVPKSEAPKEEIKEEAQ